MEQTAPEDSDFIPEIEFDDNGLPKSKPFKQKDIEPLSEYGG